MASRLRMIKMKKIVFLLALLIVTSGIVYSAQEKQTALAQLKGEVMDVEELKEPLGSAIYTVKDLATGKTVKLFVDPYRSLIKIGDSTKTVGDVMGGSKVTIIYQKSEKQPLPEVVFAKVTNSYA